MKHYRTRAFKFFQRASTVEDKLAWQEVLKWFDTILDKSTFNAKRGSIGLPQIEIEKLNQEFQNEFVV